MWRVAQGAGACLKICLSKVRVHALQSGQAALAAQQYNAALYWFQLVRTWAPSSLQAEVDLCTAAGAVAAPPV